MGKMRVALFNAENGTISEEFIDTNKGIKDYYNFLECSCFDVVYVANGIDAYVDDEGLMVANPRINYVMTERGMIPLAGNIVFTGGVDKNGNTLPFEKDLDLLNVIIMRSFI